MKKFRFLGCIALGGFMVLVLSGCTTLNEGAKRVIGVSTKSLEYARKDGIVKAFNDEYSSCYAKTLDILKKLGCYAYFQDVKKYEIAIYLSESDQTAVGVFFKEVSKGKIEVEVASSSTYAKEFIAKRLFSGLDKILSVDQELNRIAKEKMK